MPARSSGGLPLLVCLAALALAWNLDGYRLLDPDEGRNAEVAREMAQTHDYLVPHLDGLPYLDKPLAYFAVAAGFMDLLGPTETAARLPAYLATLATLALLASFARRQWGAQAGWLAAVAYATMVLPLAYARTAIFDSALTLCTTAAILWGYEGRALAAWGAMGAGALTKGPIALAIPLLVLVVHALATGARVRALFSWRGLGAFALVVLPWFVAVSLRYPQFPYYVFVRETFQRLATPSFHRTAPWWFFLPIVPVAAFPWLVPALAPLRTWPATWRARREAAAREPLLLACWVIAPLVLLTLNQSKLPQYVLPLMPAFALAAARTLATRGIGAGARIYGAVALAVGAALVALTRWLPAPIDLTAAEKAAIPPTAFWLGLVVLCSAALVVLGALRRDVRVGALGYAVVVMAIPFVSGGLLAAVGEDRSSAGIAGAMAGALARAGGGSVVGVAAYPPSLPFYLRQPVVVATATARELTSNYIADYHERYRGAPASPLRPAGFWREALLRCPAPTIFLATAGDRDARAVLGATLPLLVADGHYAAYGPCRTPGRARRPGPGPALGGFARAR
ncbi:MAG TPA: glycosyltransferase family 39 protein [Gemmatimonadales bacterium]|nr:glycosyltransferase family 39 protein [Gemmatimonadales bacterium]